MANNQSPFRDLNKAHSILESCITEPQLDGAFNFFELVLQKWESLFSEESVNALRVEFRQEYFAKKALLKLD